MSDEKEKEYVQRIMELEHAVRALNQLWDKEFKAHYNTQLQVIKLQKRILGIKEDA